MPSKEIVDLVITAENLATKELEKAAKDVTGLGKAVDKTEKELDQLKVDQGIINSYKQLTQEVSELDNALASSVVEFEQQKKALKANKKSTTEDAEAVQKQSQSVKRQRSELGKRNNELIKAKVALKTLGVITKDLAETERKYAANITITKAKLIDLNRIQDKRVATLKSNVAVEERLVSAQKKSTAETKKKANAQDRAALADKKSAEAQKLSIEQSKKYSLALKKLNLELKKGNITKEQYIASEAKLRIAYKQTAIQATAAGFAIKSNTASTKAAQRATDRLTKVTRRLAQAYVVLNAAQGAGRVLTENVKEFGQLEAAQIKVLKTTDLMKSEIITMTDELIKLSTDVTPTATNELLRYAEVAGQLGVEGSENILRMVAAADALNVSTDLAGDEAATLLTRILTMTKEGVPAIDGLASTVVALGNNTATTESEIVQMTKEIVTGTQALNIGSTAAAGYGATLKEIGQRGESSRSAFTRLSNAIKLSVLEGGDDLIRLQNITGQTAESLKKNLGDAPEKILLDFVKGLRAVKDEGGSVKNTLDSFGLTSLDTLSVIESLATNVERLERNLKLADEAQVAGNAHLIEAAKAYASQESALGRLNNKFIEIKASLGEAFSDDTTNLIESVGDAIDNNRELIFSFFDGIAELGVEFVELSGSIKGVVDSFAELIGITDGAGTSFKVLSDLMNLLQNGFNGIAFALLAVRESYLVWKKLIVGGTPEIVKALEEVREKMYELSVDVVKNNQDMVDSAADLEGSSSKSYRDLLKSVEKYGDILDKLDPKQKAQLDEILKTKGYNADLNDSYREIVASLDNVGRANDIYLASQKLKNENDEKALILQTAKNESYVDEIEGQKALVIELAQVESRLETIRTQWRLNIITESEYFSLAGDLIVVQKDLKGAITGVLDVLKPVGTLTESVSKEYEVLSAASFKLKVASEKAALALEKANKAVKKAAENTNDLAKAEKKLANAKRNSINADKAYNDQRELEKLNVRQLKLEYDRLVKAIKAEQRAKDFSSGSTTKYNKKLDELKKKLAEVNKLLGDSKTSKDDDSEANKNNEKTVDDLTEATKDNTKAKEDNTEATNDNFTASVELYSANDLLGLSVDELTDRYNLLNETFAGVTTTIGNLSETGRQIDGTLRRQKEFELNFIRSELAARKLQDRLKSGNLTLSELNSISAQVNGSLLNLGDSQLKPLRSAIESARREFERLDESINRSLSRTKDRLDRLLGNEADILNRRNERELADAQKQLAAARESGDRNAVATANENIKLLKQVQRIEVNNLKETEAIKVKQREEAAKAAIATASTASESASSGDGGIPLATVGNGGVSRRVEVRITLPNGNVGRVDVADDVAAENLVDILSALGENSIAGVN